MWSLVMFIAAVLLSVSAVIQSMGPSARDGQEVAQAQSIRRIAIETSVAARVALTDEPAADLTDIGLPPTLPDAALYGRRDLFLPYSALVPGAHDWLPVARASAGAVLPPMDKGTSLADARSYEVGVLSCRKLLADPAPGAYSAYASFCPSSSSRSYHLLVLKAGWTAKGPTPLLSPDEIVSALKRDFGYVRTTAIDAWRHNGSPTVDSFVILL